MNSSNPTFTTLENGSYIIRCKAMDDDNTSYKGITYSHNISFNVNNIVQSTKDSNSFYNVISAKAIDINRDGIKDIVYLYEDTGIAYAGVSIQESINSYTFYKKELTKDYIDGDTSLYYGDFNGDGSLDMLMFNVLGSKIYNLENNRFKLLQELNIIKTVTENQPLDPIEEKLAIADLNKDGKDDIIKYTDGNKTLTIYTDIRDLNKTITLKDDNVSLSNIKVVDINGDGLKDIISMPVLHMYFVNNKAKFNYSMLIFTQQNNFTFKKTVIKYDLPDATIDNMKKYIVNTTKMLDSSHIALLANNGLTIFKLDNNQLTKVFKNSFRGTLINAKFYFKDINNDGKKDIIYFDDYIANVKFGVIFQKDNFSFNNNILFTTDLTIHRSKSYLVDDIDDDGKIDIIRVDGENKFSYIYLK